MDSSEEKELEKKKKVNLFKALGLNKILFLLILVIALCAFLYFGLRYSEEFNHQEKLTKLGLENVGVLVTQTCYTTVIEDSKVNRDFFKLFEFPFTESRQIFSYDIEVDAAVDFDQIKYEIDDTNKKIYIRMPGATIYKTTLNQDSLKIYLDSESLFSRIDLNKHNEAIVKMQETAVENCKENKLLEEAQTNAEKLVNGFIKTNKVYHDYKIIFEYVNGE